MTMSDSWSVGSDSAIEGAAVWCCNPAGETIGDIRAVAMRRDAFAEVTRAVDRARIVASSGVVECRDIAFTGLVDGLSQAIAGCGAGGAVANHACNDTLGTRILHLASHIAVTGRIAIVVLHEAGVANATTC